MKFEHIKDITVHAIFQELDGARYRYLLELTSKASAGSKVACFVMQNPSIADEKQADKSVKFIERLVFEKQPTEFADVSKVLIVNQFGLVQTNGFCGSAKNIGPGNDGYIVSALARAHMVILAWGITNRYEERKNFVLSELRHMQRKDVYMATKHPSRASYNGFLREYRI